MSELCELNCRLNEIPIDGEFYKSGCEKTYLIIGEKLI